MELTEEHKNEVGKQIVLTLANAAEDKKIFMPEIKAVSAFVLERLDSCITHEQLIDFLTQLFLKWPIFSHILTVEKGKGLEEKEKEKVKQLEELIKRRKLDEALEIAKGIVNSTAKEMTP